MPGARGGQEPPDDQNDDEPDEQKKSGLPNHAQVVAELRRLAERVAALEAKAAEPTIVRRTTRDEPEPDAQRYCDECGSRLPMHFEDCTHAAPAAPAAAEPH